jgi:hypothetical protein
VLVPTNAKTDAFIEIRGGGLSGADAEVCFYDPAACVEATGKKVKSFDDLLALLQNRPKNNDLIAKLRMGNGKVKSEAMETLDQVVFGEAFVQVRIPGACCSSGGSRGGGVEPTPEGPPVK